MKSKTARRLAWIQVVAQSLVGSINSPLTRDGFGSMRLVQSLYISAKLVVVGRRLIPSFLSASLLKNLAPHDEGGPDYGNL